MSLTSPRGAGRLARDLPGVPGGWWVGRLVVCVCLLCVGLFLFVCAFFVRVLMFRFVFLLCALFRDHFFLCRFVVFL